MQQKHQKTEDLLKLFIDNQWLQNKEITTTDNILSQSELSQSVVYTIDTAVGTWWSTLIRFKRSGLK